uniref:Uncharacterized protein n=1 Tax=viral metagenome TaxID=1070528 RepID=A0A6C0BPT8_9ZZZZ
MMEFDPEINVDLDPLRATDTELAVMQKKWSFWTKKHCETKPRPVFTVNDVEIPYDETDCLVIHGQSEVISMTKPFPSSVKATTLSWMNHKHVNRLPKKDADGNSVFLRVVCGVPKCINPNHLRLGTMQQKKRDQQVREQATGVREGTGKKNLQIPDETIQAIRASKPSVPQNHPDYQTAKQRAEKFGVTLELVRGVDQGTSYTHVPNPDGTFVASHKQLTRNHQIRETALARKPKTATPANAWRAETWDELMQLFENRANVQEVQSGPFTFSQHACKKWTGSLTILIDTFEYSPRYLAYMSTRRGQAVKPNAQIVAQCGNGSCVEPSHLILKSAEPTPKAPVTPEMMCSGKCTYQKGEWVVTKCPLKRKAGPRLSGNYCGNHEKLGKLHDESVRTQAKPCANVIRCYSLLPAGYTLKTCEKCREKDAEQSKARRLKRKQLQSQQMASDQDTITCVKCGKPKPRDEFKIDNRNMMGTQCETCKAANRIQEARRPERDRKAEQREYEKRPERIESKQARKEADPAKYASYWRMHRLKKKLEDPVGYRAKAAARTAERRARNLEAEKIKMLQYRQSLKGRRDVWLRSAKDKGIPYELSDAEFENLSNSDCFYCGRAPSEGDFNGLDRLDSCVGYVADNVVGCCKTCNMSKGAVHAIDFIAQVARIVHFHTGSEAAVTLFEGVKYQSDSGSPYYVYETRAKENNLEFTLTKFEFSNLVQRSCYLCGQTPGINCGIDRVNNSLGYVFQNCQACCATCNYMKRDSQYQDFMALCTSIVDNMLVQAPVIQDPVMPDRKRMNPSPFNPAPEHLLRLSRAEKSDIVTQARFEMGDWPMVSARVSCGNGTEQDVARLQELEEIIKSRIDLKVQERIATTDIEEFKAKKRAQSRQHKRNQRDKRPIEEERRRNREDKRRQRENPEVRAKETLRKAEYRAKKKRQRLEENPE